MPDEIDTIFLKKFRKLILMESQKGKKFLILAGGGRICRTYQRAGREVANLSDDALDWIGIEVNRLNAHLLRWIFGARSYESVPTFEKFPRKLKAPITVAVGGIGPGGSSDSVSVSYAQKLGVRTIVNLTNVAGVYDRDPNKFKNAKLIPHLTWKEFTRQFGSKRSPGQHKPFDPSTAKLASRLGVKVVIMDGRDIKNLQNFFLGKTFQGTVIS